MTRRRDLGGRCPGLAALESAEYNHFRLESHKIVLIDCFFKEVKTRDVYYNIQSCIAWLKDAQQILPFISQMSQIGTVGVSY